MILKLLKNAVIVEWQWLIQYSNLLIMNRLKNNHGIYEANDFTKFINNNVKELFQNNK